MWNIRFIINGLKYEMVPPLGRVFIATNLETNSMGYVSMKNAYKTNEMRNCI